MKQTIAILMAGAFVASVVYATGATVSAQGAKSVNAGVYSAAQATRGQALYKDQCAACHGDDLAGSGPMPPLAGSDFLASWNGKTLGDLFDKIHSSMPASAPGSLTEQQTSDIIAYMLSVGKFPAGSADLDSKMDALMQIKIEPLAAAQASGAAGRSTGTVASSIGRGNANASATAGVQAAGGNNVTAGVYTSAQAMRGQSIYKDQCAACHADDLSGGGSFPALAGADFVANWKGKSVGDLFDKIHSTMPASNPGSLNEQQTSDLIAYMLSVGKYPAGMTELAAQMAPLQQIAIVPLAQ